MFEEGQNSGLKIRSDVRGRVRWVWFRIPEGYKEHPYPDWSTEVVDGRQGRSASPLFRFLSSSLCRNNPILGKTVNELNCNRVSR